jgi:hypothetical protein
MTSADELGESTDALTNSDRPVSIQPPIAPQRGPHRPTLEFVRANCSEGPNYAARPSTAPRQSHQSRTSRTNGQLAESAWESSFRTHSRWMPGWTWQG